LLVLVLLYALLGIALTMLVGWSGQVSLGHFGIVGLAAYLTARWADQRWDFLAIVLVAGLIGAAVMVLIGAPALRVGGLTLAVTTMGFAVIAHDWLYHQSWAGSRQPFVAVSPVRLGPDLGTPFSQLSIYAVALGVLVIGVVGAGYLRRLGPGRLAIAVRDNENAASAFGLVPATIKLTILAVSGFYAAVAGVIWAMAWRSATALQFSPDFSVALVAIPVIGGLGSIGGAVVAAVIVYATAFFVGPLVSGLFGDFGNNLGFQLMLAGVGQVTVLLSYPNGIAGLAQGRWQAYLDHRARSLDARSTESATATEAHAAPEPAATPAIASSIAATNGAAATAWEVGEVRSRIARRADWRTDPDAPALVTRDVRVRFGGVVALDDASITVEEGQIVGLIGPNGAGKTTLMNVISGMQRADAGSVRLFGCEVSGLPPDFRTALGVARTFQDAKLFAGLTVTETLQIALAYRNKVGTIGAMVAAPWVRAAEWSTRSEALQVARRFGLLPWADALTQDLSTGTRRICDLAAQVAARPKLLLLDEPTAGVAQREAEAFRPLLRGIRDELGCAVLIVEHDMPLLMGLCDRVYAMEAGQVVAEGTPDEIRHDPVVIASYLGSSDVAIARSGAR
jgi:ABC-type branched-subunit amino acid transport system ATPase component/ABC-type branched-subunit amino acid transport system permease subunit